MTLAELNKLDAGEVEQHLRAVTRRLDEIERERADLEENRYRLFIRAGKLGISQRTVAPWVGLTNARVHQIATGPSPGKRAAEARKRQAVSRKAQAAKAAVKRPPGRPRKTVEPEPADT